MEYDLTRLETGSFEHLCRALFDRQLGPGVGQFGAGPDGGREATFTGRLEWKSGSETVSWDGYTVLQAKFRQRPLGTSQDQSWLIQQMRNELTDWANPKKTRRMAGKVPDHLVIATNVVLSPGAGGGIDALEAMMKEFAPKAGIRSWLVWHHDKICSMLDDARDIRSAYAGLITAGDVLSQLQEYVQGSAAAIGEDIRLHAAQGLVQERFVRLTESGGFGRLTLEQVGVDLPAVRPSGDGEPVLVQTIAALVRIGDHILKHESIEPGVPSKIVIVGGPGQGKTTLSHLLAQTYRATLLGDDPDRHGPQVAPVVRSTLDLLEAQQIPKPRNKRWPMRINLAAFADDIGGRPESLLAWIARNIRETTTSEIGAADLLSWFQQWPWLLILDGFDEVASPLARNLVQEEIVNLFIQADTRTSDLLTVITTRPQGYENDFALPGVEHITLKPLDTTEALAYASRFADQHFGQDVLQRDKTLERVTTAAQDPATSRLMTSPLQVTIMTLLLEGRERPPHGRYRLFDAYFDTVYRREANKHGPSGSLLESFRKDIEHLHEQVGLRLQAASEQTSTSDATMSVDELRQLAVQRLVNTQGHELEEAATLADQIVRAATNRLVLLVPKKDGVGFEVRSLQEYLAARAMTSGSDEEQLHRLAVAAPSAHWRNTWLLAFARALDTREHLRDPLLGMLRGLDSDPLAGRVGLGPELARDLLADSIAHEVPTFRQQLLDIVLGILTLPPRPIAVGDVLVELAEERPLYRSTITEALKRGIEGREDTKAAMWLVLTDIARHIGVLPATARQLLHQVKLDTLELKATGAWLNDGGDQPSEAEFDWTELAAFVLEDPRDYLEGDDDREVVDAFMATLSQRKVRVLRADRRIVLPQGQSLLMRGVLDAPYPQSPDVRDAVAIALDGIDPLSWGASSEIRNGLWRAMRRTAVAPRLLMTPKSVDLKA
jgi:hypothetical protein